MKIVVWTIRFLIFALVFIFALRNNSLVNVRFFPGYELENVPLILVMLGCFAIGTIFGLLLAVPTSIKQKRELARMRKDHAAELAVLRAANAPPPTPVAAPRMPIPPL